MLGLTTVSLSSSIYHLRNLITIILLRRNTSHPISPRQDGTAFARYVVERFRVADVAGP